MSNINVANHGSCQQFLGDYEIGSVEMKNGIELNGEAIMRVSKNGEKYELRVPMKEGKKEGEGLIVRENGTLFMKLMFVNDECEGEVIKKNEYGIVILRGRVEKGKEVGMWIEYDGKGEEIWRGLYRNGKRYLSLKEQEGMKGLYSESNERGDLLSVSEYDENWMKNGRCFEYERRALKRECVYEHGRMTGVLKEWNNKGMIEYDENGKRVYEGGYGGDMKNGFVREGKGSEFGVDGKSAVYVGEWKNGKREGYGSEFKGLNPVYIGEWKNGKRDGEGKEMNDNGEVIISGKWTKGEFDGLAKQFEDEYGNDLSVFDVDCLKGITRLEIGNCCFSKVTRFVIDGLNELKSVIIGLSNFCLNEKNRIESSCLIMNCDQLNEIHFDNSSFFWYESFELKNLPSLISIQLGSGVFFACHKIVFDNLIRLQSITLGDYALRGEYVSFETNELIMKNLPSLTSFKGDGYNFCCIGKVTLENIPSLTEQAIQMANSFKNVQVLSSSNADSLDQFIQESRTKIISCCSIF